MADLSIHSILSLLSNGGVGAISKRTKLSEQEVANVLSAGVPILLTGMRRNSGTEAGARALCGALSEHSAADVSDPGAFLKNADLKDGKKILGHVLGNDQKAIVEQISKASGVSTGKTTSILALVAPLLLTLLGSQQQQQGSGFQVLSLLGSLLGGGQQQSSSTGLLGALLGGGQQTQSGTLHLASNQSQQTQQSGSVLDALGGLGGLASLFSDGTAQQSQQDTQEGSVLDGFLNLFR